MQAVKRLLVAAAAAGLVASYALTWSLWQARADPPNLPILGFPQWDFGALLVVAAVLSALLPRIGATAHSIVLVGAVLADQTRLQPEFVSMAVILAGAAWPRNGVHIARWHLISLWFWAGLNKVLSAGWPSGGATFIASAMGLARFRGPVAVLVPLVEIGLGLLALRPKAWAALRWGAVAFHLGTFAVLAAAGFNSAVWAWNVALAATAWIVFSQPESSRPAGLPNGRRGAALAAAAGMIVLYPAGFYFGAIDAYMAHNLYTSNTADASACPSEPMSSDDCMGLIFAVYDELNVPLPPEPRVFNAYFDRTCVPGDVLRLYGRWVRYSSRTISERPCPVD